MLLQIIIILIIIGTEINCISKNMYVCICNGVTDKQIIRQAQSGATSLRDLQDSLGVATNCGKCAKLAKDILAEHQVFPSGFVNISRADQQARITTA